MVRNNAVLPAGCSRRRGKDAGLLPLRTSGRPSAAPLALAGASCHSLSLLGTQPRATLADRRPHEPLRFNPAALRAENSCGLPPGLPPTRPPPSSGPPKSQCTSLAEQGEEHVPSCRRRGTAPAAALRPAGAVAPALAGAHHRLPAAPAVHPARTFRPPGRVPPCTSGGTAGGSGSTAARRTRRRARRVGRGRRRRRRPLVRRSMGPARAAADAGGAAWGVAAHLGGAGGAGC